MFVVRHDRVAFTERLHPLIRRSRKIKNSNSTRSTNEQYRFGRNSFGARPRVKNRLRYDSVRRVFSFFFFFVGFRRALRRIVTRCYTLVSKPLSNRTDCFRRPNHAIYPRPGTPSLELYCSRTVTNQTQIERRIQYVRYVRATIRRRTAKVGEKKSQNSEFRHDFRFCTIFDSIPSRGPLFRIFHHRGTDPVGSIPSLIPGYNNRPGTLETKRVFRHATTVTEFSISEPPILTCLPRTERISVFIAVGTGLESRGGGVRGTPSFLTSISGRTP